MISVKYLIIGLYVLLAFFSIVLLLQVYKVFTSPLSPTSHSVGDKGDPIEIKIIQNGVSVDITGEEIIQISPTSFSFNRRTKGKCQMYAKYPGTKDDESVEVEKFMFGKLENFGLDKSLFVMSRFETAVNGEIIY
jgi:hypothetical protein